MYFNLDRCNIMDLTNPIDNELNFQEVRVSILWKDFVVLYSPLVGEIVVKDKIITEAVGIFKPLTMYKSFEFENLFGFQRDCEGFRDDKMIIVTRS